MPTRNGDVVPYGLDEIVPSHAHAAWGARLIVTQDGSIDFLADRQGCAGEERDLILATLGRELSPGALKARISDLLSGGEMQTRQQRDFLIHSSDQLEVHANTNASAGYCYVTAWLKLPFWDAIKEQWTELCSAKSTDDVLRILSAERNPYGRDWDGQAGDGFFAGSGDDTVQDALLQAGWRVTWAESSIYYVMQAPNGDKITYIEGDIYRGDTHGPGR